MRTRSTILAVTMCSLTLSAQSAPFKYPPAKTVDQVDDFFGTKVADPYRWLEDVDSADARSWIEAENQITFSYLATIPSRPRLKQRLTELWNYERFGPPSRYGTWYFFTKNDGLQNQAVLYKATALDAAPQVLLDPNTLSADGTVALAAAEFSEDGRYMVYATAASGSDWHEWHVREVATATDLPDLIKWSKFSGAAWTKDGSGFFYGRYDAPKEDAALQAVNKNQRIYFHKLGMSQDADTLVYERPDHPEWIFDVDVTDDGRFLLVMQSEGSEPKNRVFLKDLTAAGAKVEPFLDDFDAFYGIVGNDADRFYVFTNQGAPRARLLAIDRASPQPASRRIVIPEAAGRDVLEGVSMVNDQFVAVWMTDAHSRLDLWSLEGSRVRDIVLPGLGSIGAVTGRRVQREAFYTFTSFIQPTSVYRFDFGAGASSIYRQPKLTFDATRYETVQVFYPSKDGTKIPMFLTHRKGLQKNGQHPTYLYAYGGFNVSETPSFSSNTILWLEMGGVFALANLRGGGEYGQEWHDAGRLARKQNVFDDFIAAAQYLINEKYTSTPKLAIAGGSNGGLLVGACLTQRPDLFGATLPAVGVMDMLRFHKFTIGWAWTSDYGSAESKEGFETLIKYSPLQNIKPGTKYPATLVTTADHDDRVVPAHSFKFTAALQAAQAGPAPVLIRIETKAGHGAGKPTTKIIEERADVYAFLVRELQMELPSEFGSAH